MGWWTEHVVPRMADKACGTREIDEYREKIPAVIHAEPRAALSQIAPVDEIIWARPEGVWRRRPLVILIAVRGDDQAVSVVFELMNPVVAFGRLLHQRCELRRPEFRQ